MKWFFAVVVFAATTSFAADAAAEARRFFDQGRAAMTQNDADRAAKMFEEAIERAPRNAEYHFWLGQAYGQQALRAGKLKQVMLAKKVQSEFETAVKLDPNLIDARLGLINFYLMAPGFMGGSEKKAKEQVTEIRKRDSLKGALASARLHRQNKRDDLVEKEYLAAAAAHPKSALPRVWLSVFYSSKNDFDRAFEYVDAALQAEPNYMPTQFWIGRVAAVSGQQLERGESALRKYLTYTPKDDEPNLGSAHYRLGQIYEKSGRKNLARQHYLEAQKSFPQMKELTEAIKRVS